MTLLRLAAPWSADTHKGERPFRDVLWDTLLLNGDIQVIYQPDPPDQDRRHRQNYYLAIFNEGVWEPMAQLECDFDVRRHLQGFHRIECETYGTHDDLCGLFRHEEMDRRPLFQRGYALNFTSFERGELLRIGQLMREHARGYQAGSTDWWLNNGYVHTNHKGPGSCHELIEDVKWLL